MSGDEPTRYRLYGGVGAMVPESDGTWVHIRDLGAVDEMAELLRDALQLTPVPTRVRPSHRTEDERRIAWKAAVVAALDAAAQDRP